MNPNNQRPPSDYLDQIAPQAQGKMNFLHKPPILIGGIVLVVIVLLFSIVASLSGGIKPTEQLAARLVTTESTATDATTKLKSSQLRKTNVDLKSRLTNIIYDIGPLLATDGIKIDNLSKNVLSAESNANMLSTLEDARLNAIYDRTYAREMAYQLDTVLTLMLQIYNNSNSKSLKSFLTNARTNLEPIQKEFEDFNLATS